MSSKNHPKAMLMTEPGAADAGTLDDFEAVVPAARALPKTAVRPFRGDASVMLHNIVFGAGEIVAEAAQRPGVLSETQLAQVRALPRTALALFFAVRQSAPAPSDGSIARKLARAAELRRLLLPALDACAAAKLVPASDVARIHRGRGKLDLAQ